MARKIQKPPTTTTQLEPLLKAFALKRLQQDSATQNMSQRTAKPRAKKSKKG